MSESEEPDLRTQYIRAVRANNYFHYSLAENMDLVTEPQEDGEFNPYVVLHDDEIHTDDVQKKVWSEELFTWEDCQEVEQEERFNYVTFENVNFLHST